MFSTNKQIEFERQLDLTLIRQFRKTGKLDLLSDAFDKYVPLLYGVAYKFLKNRTASQSAVVLIFEKLCIETVKTDINNLRQWLYVEIKDYCYKILKDQNADLSSFKNWQTERKMILSN
ncbi:MAG TPA: hypothetical protein VJY41_11765 [Prolixibacteraceae bacterium]|nr:hypothetical protein [Prolixibacteraceae bacterium]